MPTDTKLNQLVINYLTEEQLKNTTVDDNQLYLTDDTTVIPTKTSELENDSGYVNETQLAAQLRTKQNVLTAGTGIKIVNNVISLDITSAENSTF